jgi:hypothetical protein
MTINSVSCSCPVECAKAASIQVHLCTCGPAQQHTSCLYLPPSTYGPVQLIYMCVDKGHSSIARSYMCLGPSFCIVQAFSHLEDVLPSSMLFNARSNPAYHVSSV